MPRLRWPLVFLLAAVFLTGAVAADSSAASSTPTSSAPTSLSLTTSYTPFVTTIQSGGNNVTFSTTVPVSTFNVTVTATSTASASASSDSAAAAASMSAAAEAARTLDTRIDPAFGVLGALLILTGLPSAFLGHKNRWTSFFLIGVYTFALVCFSLIIRFGVLQAVNPPTKTVRGLFMLACGVAGIAGGGIAIFFWQATRYFVGAWGGFVVALWIQCFRDGGLISPIGLRWILYIVLGVIGFVLCTIPKIHYHVLLLSTSFVGATAVILGIDCFTTGDLKEFYVWNLGFTALFPKFSNNGIKFPINQTMEIELGLIGAISLMGIAVQFQVLKVLQQKLKEIKEMAKRQDEELENRAAIAFDNLEREKAEWEREHPTLGMHGRKDSEFSSLLKESDERQSPSFSPRQRYQSGVSDFIAAPIPTEEMHRSTSKLLQSPGALPVLDLGLDIENDVPKNYIAEDTKNLNVKETPKTQAELEDLKRKQDLLAEIQTIRKSIEILKTEGTDPSSSSSSRRPSFTSRRTLSQDIGSLMPVAPAHLRPPRQADPRGRVQSMELSSMTSKLGASIGRPTSAPLRDDDWDTYVRERKLLQPPSGVTPPIATTPVSPTPRVPVSAAVEEALVKRQRLESTYSANGLDIAAADVVQQPPPVQKATAPSHDIPIVLRAPHARSHSQGGVPLTILPPRKPAVSRSPQPTEPPVPWTTRTLTFEELEDRHREKIRELQGPLTRAEKEQTEIAEAKARWEKARAAEKQAVAKRQADKAAAVSKEAAKQHKSSEHAGPSSSKQKSRTMEETAGKPRHSRSLSADVLANVPGATSSKRLSMMKVEDWQKHQQDVELGLRPEEHAQRTSRRRSAVPFPEAQERLADGRDARRHSRTPREMLS